MRIKVCCVQSVEEAKLAISNGAHAIGLVSQMPGGSRFMIDDHQIRAIVEATPATFSTVLLTSEVAPAKIIRHQRATKANTLQLLGPLEPECVRELRDDLPGISLIKVVSVVDAASVDYALRFSTAADALLLDSSVKHRDGGGTGVTHDWSISRRIVEASPLPVFLAGGLCPENVAEAVRTVAPAGIDVCSSLRPNGALDASLLRDFMANASSLAP